MYTVRGDRSAARELFVFEIGKGKAKRLILQLLKEEMFV